MYVDELIWDCCLGHLREAMLDPHPEAPILDLNRGRANRLARAMGRADGGLA